MTPVTFSTQELRLATTMTGGVSLSVWMGGVTREINLLLQASEWRRADQDPVQGELSEQAFASLKRYHELLDLLDTVVDVDVLSGTSAGGINAVLLGYARVNDLDLGGLRDIWLKLGAFENLLRNPTDANIPSLFYGDERMFSALAEEMLNLEHSAVPSGDAPLPTTLLVTTTLLTGEASGFTDSFGTQVQDVNQRGLFTFDENQLAGLENVPALALAGRSSASYPGAFEPSFLPFGAKIPGRGNVPERPDMKPFMNTTRAHWAADGGMLDNQPLDVILDRVFQRPSEGPIRRVLLYVVPTSGPAPDLDEAAAPDDIKNPYGLLDGLLKDISAIKSQSIARDLRDITDHNDRIDTRRDRRRQLCELAMLRPNSRLLTSTLLNDCTQQMVAEQAQRLVRPMLKVLSTWAPQPDPSDRSAPYLPEGWQKDLKVAAGAEAKCRSAIADALRPRYRFGTGTQLPNSAEAYAKLGPDPLQGAKSIVLAALRLAYAVAAQVADTYVLAGLVQRAHAAAPLGPGVSTNTVAEALSAAARAKPPVTLVAAAHALAADYLDERLDASPASWLELADVLVAIPGLPTPPPAEARRFPAAYTLTTLMNYLRPASALPTPPPAEARRSSAAYTLTTLMNYLRPASADPVAVARRLFDLAAVERAMEPIDANRDQPVELVQVSADTRTALDLDRRTAKSKLTGMQFHNFGAFYKKSWRANDWMWGRLDGAGWLVHVLLDPRRLKIVAEAAPDPIDAQAVPNPKARWLLDKLAALAKIDLPPTLDDLHNELAFLDHSSVETPPSLPDTALWLAQTWQNDVLGEELPAVAEAILGYPVKAGKPAKAGKLPKAVEPPDWSPADSRTWAAQVEKTVAPNSNAYLASLLAKCPVPDETLDSDKGSPLMRRTITKAAATATGAVGSVRQLPGPVRPAASVLRTLALAAYRVVGGAKGSTLWMLVAGGLLLTFGVLAASLSWTVPSIVGGGAAAVGGYLIVLGTWQCSSRMLGALVSFTVIGAVAALTFPNVRHSLFGTSSMDVGVVGRNIHWVGSEWWHPLIVILVVIVIGALSIITSQIARSGFSRLLRDRAWRIALRATEGWVLAVCAFGILRGWLFGDGADDSGWVGRSIYWLGSDWWHFLIVIVAAPVIGCLFAGLIILFRRIINSKRVRNFFKGLKRWIGQHMTFRWTIALILAIAFLARFAVQG